MRLPFIRRARIQQELSAAREKERLTLTTQHRKNLEAVRSQLEKSHQMAMAQAHAEIESLKASNEELRDVVREASDLSLQAAHYVNAVNQMAIDNGFQSHRMMEAVTKSHQAQLYIAENVKNLARETDQAMSRGRKRLERGL